MRKIRACCFSNDKQRRHDGDNPHFGKPAGRRSEREPTLEETMDRGSKFYEPTGETTEWEDILIKKGILAPKTKVQEEEEESDEEQVDPREYATLDELDEMEVRPAPACCCIAVYRSCGRGICQCDLI